MIDDDYDLTESGVDVVVLHAIPETDLVMPTQGTASVDLSSDTVDAVTLDELVASSTVLSAPDGVPHDVVSTLHGTPAPAAFISSPWLREHRALVFLDGQCRIGDHVLVHDRKSGVHVRDEW
ncbi:hypothetical protein F0L68_40660 [Solihabitans fulvus]|uniref:Cas3 C-terminal domain-containing protein n=1 Tax=Solihabitans fulvus TaxID=1892852 RepID=A0A5B2W5H4_9PSEU|nr:hypothetical protein [Solihabitans fulvus]KAA2246404.1 hypothetical protein F0L68_40660 [Solihabitans fulvus]